MREEFKIIIKYLYEREQNFVSSLELSKLIGVSSKTVIQYMSFISNDMKKNGALIESKTGNGYRLVIIDEMEFDYFFEHTILNKLRSINDDEECVHFMIQQFLCENTVKTDVFEEELYLNRRAISTLYRRVEQFISEFSIQMIRKSSQGNSLIGSEHNLRCCINYEMHYNKISKKTNTLFRKTYVNEDITNQIYNCILSIQSRYSGNYLSHVDLQELSSALYIAHIRDTLGFKLDYDEDTIERFNKRNSFYMAFDIISLLKEELSLNLMQEDVVFTTIFIVARRSFTSKRAFPVNEDYKECEVLAIELANYLQTINHFKYIASDKQLIESLSLNLTQLITQSEYNLYSAITIHRAQNHYKHFYYQFKQLVIYLIDSIFN